MKRSFDNNYEPAMSQAKQQCRKETLGFQIYPVDKFKSTFPYFREPKEVGSFSHDSERNFRHDRHQLMYYVPPQDIDDVSFDLREGYHTFIKKDDSVKDKLDDMLKWVLLNKTQFLVKNQTKQPLGREWYYINLTILQLFFDITKL